MFSPRNTEEYVRHDEETERRREAIGRYRRQQFELFELDEQYPECPNCGEHAAPVSFDYGVDGETGYHDAGEACLACCPRGRD